MKRAVTKAKRPWLAGIAIAGLAIVYLVLTVRSRYPEPGPNLVYDTEPFEQVDQVETSFRETGRIEPAVENPAALAAGPDGRLYVAGADAVLVLDEAGDELERIPLDGSPTSMAVAPGGGVFVGKRDRISVYETGGAGWSDWPVLGPRAYITSLAVDETDVFAADAGNRVVLRFGHDGALRNRIGEADPERDIPGLLVPSAYLDVALNSEGALWVTNPGRLGLESYREDGGLITSWYKPSLELEGFTGCCNPSHIAFRGDGKLITAEKGLVRVKVYDVAFGAFEALVAGSASFPKKKAVTDLAVDSRGRILVLDSGYNAVRVFEAKETGDEPASEPA